MDTKNDTLILEERRGNQIWLTLNRADKANAMTVAMMERTTAALIAAGDNPEIVAVVLTAAGERVFCGGVDIREQSPNGSIATQRERRSLALAALQDAVMDTPKPVIAVLNGTASGAGAMLALLADACVAAESASLALAEIDIGIATFSGANILEAIGGRALALDLIQTGRRMPAREAQSRGLVRTVAGPGQLNAAGSELASCLGGKPLKAFVDNKNWLNRGIRAALNEARTEHARHREQASG